MVALIIGFAGGIISLLFAAYLIIHILKLEQGNRNMIEIASAIREGAVAYLNRQYKTLVIFVIILAVILGFFS